MSSLNIICYCYQTERENKYSVFTEWPPCIIEASILIHLQCPKCVEPKIPENVYSGSITLNCSLRKTYILPEILEILRR
jgi:hypothetical protein